MSISSPDQAIDLDPRIKVWPLDVSSKEEKYLLELGQERRFEVSRAVYQVVRLLLDGCRTTRELATALEKEGFQNSDVHHVADVIDKFLVPYGIVKSSQPPSNVAPPITRPSQYLRFKLPLLEPATVEPITRVLDFLFRKEALIAIVAMSLAAHVIFYTKVFPGFTWSIMELPLFYYALMALAQNATAMFHELGHATACRHYGCSHGKIGWGIYIFMPVFYTDVSSIWRLPRLKRALVDFGGIYFELIAAVVFLVIYAFDPQPFWIYLFLLLDLSILGSLNPILRRDGFWLLTDLSGHAHLRRTSLDTIRWAVGRLLGRAIQVPTALSDLPRWLRLVIYSYSVGSVVFSIYFMTWMFQQMTGEILPSIPALAAEIVESFRQQPTAFGTAFERGVRLLVAIGLGLLIGSACWRFALSLLRSARGLFQEASLRRQEP